MLLVLLKMVVVLLLLFKMVLVLTVETVSNVRLLYLTTLGTFLVSMNNILRFSLKVLMGVLMVLLLMLVLLKMVLVLTVVPVPTVHLL